MHQEEDAERDRFLRSKGFEVLRIKASRVSKYLTGVVQEVRHVALKRMEELGAASSPPGGEDVGASPTGEGSGSDHNPGT